MGYLQSCGHDSRQVDLSIELILRLLSKTGLGLIRRALRLRDTPSTRYFLKHFERYESTIDAVIGFLQGNNETFALRITQHSILPEGPRFKHLRSTDALIPAFGALGTLDQARHLASLYLDDLADVIRDCIDPDFQFSKYAERIAASQATFDPLEQKLMRSDTLIDRTLK